jgi:hypothetical protein
MTRSDLFVVSSECARQKHQTTHEFRNLRIFENFDGGFTLEGSFGALQGATIRELYERFVTAERLADWEEARDIHGDQTNQSHLARTEAQRRADALEAALLQASGTLPDTNLPEPSVNIAMSPDMFENGLATLTNTESAPLDPRNYRNSRCETFSGTQLDPADAVAAAIKGHIRRVVYTTPEASISQKGRFFTGALRQLLNVIDPSCAWTGCNIPAHHCQGDHTRPRLPRFLDRVRRSGAYPIAELQAASLHGADECERAVIREWVSQPRRAWPCAIGSGGTAAGAHRR